MPRTRQRAVNTADNRQQAPGEGAAAVDAGLAHWPPFAVSIVCSLVPRKLSGVKGGSETLREILRVPLGTVSECLWCSCAKVQWFSGALLQWCKVFINCFRLISYLMWGKRNNHPTVSHLQNVSIFGRKELVTNFNLRDNKMNI